MGTLCQATKLKVLELDLCDCMFVPATNLALLASLSSLQVCLTLTALGSFYGQRMIACVLPRRKN